MSNRRFTLCVLLIRGVLFAYAFIYRVLVQSCSLVAWAYGTISWSHYSRLSIFLWNFQLAILVTSFREHPREEVKPKMQRARIRLELDWSLTESNTGWGHWKTTDSFLAQR